ncbi:hypothetical protein D0962_34540 [Leptolyngbyaceae cyanobacterium CCMR0082]|uniref:Uncharacterized protein n=1 Tax=Adonisia turfae CCMR0082 TaxID=2304604 RepID=A0A6M0SH32_9CYAN|nr:hypothetical protein [Adonisia turfae CCMR0082]
MHRVRQLYAVPDFPSVPKWCEGIAGIAFRQHGNAKEELKMKYVLAHNALKQLGAFFIEKIPRQVQAEGHK